MRRTKMISDLNPHAQADSPAFGAKRTFCASGLSGNVDGLPASFRIRRAAAVRFGSVRSSFGFAEARRLAGLQSGASTATRGASTAERRGKRRERSSALFRFFVILFAAALLFTGLAGGATAFAQQSGTASGQAALPSNLFDAMQKAYAEMDSMRCEFEQTLIHRESGGKTVRRGVLEFKKPLLARWEVKGDDPELLVVSASDVWDYLPEEEVAYRYATDVVDRDNSFLKIVTGQANLSQNFEIASEAQADDGTVEYHLYPFRPTQQLTEAYVRIDAADGPQRGVIRRVRIIDFFGNENDIRFFSSDLKANLSASHFSFTPPAGVDVEDNRNNADAPGPNLFQ